MTKENPGVGVCDTCGEQDCPSEPYDDPAYEGWEVGEEVEGNKREKGS
jgi:hypothetical protein